MPRRPATFRQTDIARAIRGAEAAGVEVARIEVAPDGRIVIVTGKQDTDSHNTGTNKREIVL